MPRQPNALIRTDAGSSYPVPARCAHPLPSLQANVP